MTAEQITADLDRARIKIAAIARLVDGDSEAALLVVEVQETLTKLAVEVELEEA